LWKHFPLPWMNGNERRKKERMWRKAEGSKW